MKNTNEKSYREEQPPLLRSEAFDLKHLTRVSGTVPETQQLFLLTVISHISDSVWYLCSLFVGYSSPHSNMPNDYRISEITPLNFQYMCVYLPPATISCVCNCVWMCACECVVFPCTSAVRGRKPTWWHAVKGLMQFVAQGLLSGCHVLLPPPFISDPPILHSLLCRHGRVVKSSQK